MQQAQISSIQMLSALKANKLRTSSIQLLGCKTANCSKYHPSGSPQHQKATSAQYHPFQCACQYIIHFYDYSHGNGTNSDIIHPQTLVPLKLQQAQNTKIPSILTCLLHTIIQTICKNGSISEYHPSTHPAAHLLLL
jgi:hypothetical protein